MLLELVILDRERRVGERRAIADSGCFLSQVKHSRELERLLDSPSLVAGQSLMTCSSLFPVYARFLAERPFSLLFSQGSVSLDLLKSMHFRSGRDGNFEDLSMTALGLLEELLFGTEESVSIFESLSEGTLFLGSVERFPIFLLKILRRFLRTGYFPWRRSMVEKKSHARLIFEAVTESKRSDMLRPYVLVLECSDSFQSE